MSEVTITTFDNPHNPFTEVDEWESFDRSHGYNTWNRVARLAETSISFSDEKNEEETNAAIDRLCELVPGIWKKVTRNTT